MNLNDFVARTFFPAPLSFEPSFEGSNATRTGDETYKRSRAMTLAEFGSGLAKFQFWHNGCFVRESI
jgi:hypothetical protein